MKTFTESSKGFLLSKTQVHLPKEKCFMFPKTVVGTLTGQDLDNVLMSKNVLNVLKTEKTTFCRVKKPHVEALLQFHWLNSVLFFNLHIFSLFLFNSCESDSVLVNTNHTSCLTESQHGGGGVVVLPCWCRLVHSSRTGTT